MRKRRVVITGMGAVSPYGVGIGTMWEGLSEQRCALSLLPDSMLVPGLEFRVAGLVPEIGSIKAIPREIRRTMSPMSVYAYLAALEALGQAGFDRAALPRIGVSIGSTMGSGQELKSLFGSYIPSGNLDAVRTTAFFKIMSHTAASSLAVSLGLTGRMLNPTAACAAGLQAMGLAYEAIAFGREDRMLCGGTEEYTPLTSATFDKIGAASLSTVPEDASRPFDARRDGIVCSEGAGIFMLEELETALAAGHTPLAEITGFASLSSPSGIAQPDTETTLDCMRAALDDAETLPEQIAYANAHATSTLAGDIGEGLALERLFGSRIPVGSLKGGMGHAMAASGALESAACVRMIRTGMLCPSRDDLVPDPACGALRFARRGERLGSGSILKNSFALGGVYASMVFTPCKS